MKGLKLFIALYCLSTFMTLNAQETIKGLEFVDVIYLKNGAVFRGNITDYQQDKKVSIEISDKHLLNFNMEDVLNIKQERLEAVRAKEQIQVFTEEEKQTKAYKFKETGWYNVTYFALANGQVSNDIQFGVGLHNITGYMWKRLLGVGFGIGVDNYAVGTGEIIYPVFVEARGYLTPSLKSLYYSLAAGYGLAFKNDNNFITRANGGLMAHPALGLRLGASAESNVTIDIGFKLQYAGFTREIPFTGEIDIREVVYKRLTVRAGLLF